MKPSQSNNNILKQSESLGIIAHEIKSPISVTVQLLQTVEILLESQEIEKAQRMVTRARKRAQSALELTRNLLEYIKVEKRDRIEEKSAQLIISKRIPVLLEKHLHQAELRNVRIICDFGCGSTPVTAREFEFDLIADNLISNAIRYSKRSEGDQRVWVRTLAGGGGVILEVEDEGIGMSDEDQDKIFGGFYRSSQAKEQTISGSGLGMAIVRNIIDQMGARIECDSEPGRGTKFTVVFPRASG